MNSTVTPEQQAALQHYGVTLHDFIFYEGRRLDGQYARLYFFLIFTASLTPSHDTYS